ncbi:MULTISPECIES: crosslink repair DNA glycosylase YcaQ family protein [unclassified Bosea (in: a-proteobacteria)]|uniref:winged helix-turn-helix domain-containing protein n=1 Tax=unclassified Bosea (in: a-proteobacteria) TaxID=2653178 RepID=UPI000F75A29B|nr:MULTISPECIES: crosslink repair DNA glycosylase YcaQ family protein [unclassified Bosea (in: a-proteobacteria)]AZO80018.1 cytoplasmic protein [Bosea sp. Tri-49]RXT22798.1 cytoplasmic protein [Bosea sp. Tri-39]RXT38267.1 cytoplasmic protein [Bosea sp. Tri-54]
MATRPRKILKLDKANARRILLKAQKLDTREPFGAGPEATAAAIAHLGYVQIDTINVVERCHHHILYSRIPGYRRDDLAQAQSLDKSVFEYWTHALSYVASADLRYFLPAMKAHRAEPKRWASVGSREETRKLLRRIRKDGALTIRDIDTDVLVEKTHLWASKKPSKGLLERAFYDGELAISSRSGMLKTYELLDRHFGWEKSPTPASERQIAAYKLDRALQAQGIVSLDSICHLDAPSKKAIAELIAGRVRRKELVPVAIEGAEKTLHWARPEVLEPSAPADDSLVHILSPFDPLIIQRKRLKLFFGYDHVFEAYLPKEKRVFGYFGLPVLAGDRIVAVADLKTDRAARKLLVQQWTWLEPELSPELKRQVDEEMQRFERFQLGDGGFSSIEAS